MKTVSVPWKAWYGDEACALTFPASWEVQWCPMADAPPASDNEIRQAFSCPIGCPPLEVVARGRKRVAIAVDDLTRPTPTRQLLPFVLERLNSAGIAARQITIVVALGSHAPLAKSAVVAKLGMEVLRDYTVVQHHPSQNVGEVGIAFDGIPVRVNKDFLDADLRLSMGGYYAAPFCWL